MRSENPSTLVAVVLVAVAIGAAVFLAMTMTHGAGVSPDSVIYLGMAESVRHGAGFLFDGSPVTHSPPGYSIMLAAIGSVAGSVTAAARWLGAAWFGANIALVGWAAYVTTRRIAAPVTAVLLFGVSSSVLYLHSMAWTEAPFFFFTLAGLLWLARWNESSRRRDLATAAAMFAAAMVLRYVGITLLAPLALAVTLLGQRTVRQRIGDAAVAFACALLPLVAWMVRDRLVAQQATDRIIAMHLIDLALLRQMVVTLSDFIVPVDIPIVCKLIIVIVIGAVIVAGAWGGIRRVRARDLASAFISVATAFGAAYLIFLIVSISFLDATTPLDDRILFPLFGVVIVTLVIVAARAAEVPSRRWLWPAFEGCALVSLVLRVQPAHDTLDTIRNEGTGYASDLWHNSPMLARVKALPPTVIVYSNAQDAIQFLLGRSARWLPDDQVWESMTPNPDFEMQRAAMCRDVLSGAAVVALFNTEDPDDEWALAQTAKMCPSAVMDRVDDGALYSTAQHS